MTILVNRQHIKNTHALWQECDFLCLVAKNLYNHCLYQIRQYSFLQDDHCFSVSEETELYRQQQVVLKEEFLSQGKGKYFNFEDSLVLGKTSKLDAKTNQEKVKKRYCFDTTELYQAVKNSPEFRTKNHTDYGLRQINTKILKQTLRHISQDFSNYFASFKAYKKNPSSFLGEPRLPFYKEKGDKGRCAVTIPLEAISVNKKKNLISFGGTKISFPLDQIKDKNNNILDKSRMLEAKIVPLCSGYDILISYVEGTKEEYKTQKKPNKENKKAKQQDKKKSEQELNRELFFKLKQDYENQQKVLRVAGCDMGVNNIASLCGVSLTSNNPDNTLNRIAPLVVNGRHIKSINQYYNKGVAELKSELAQNTRNQQKTSCEIKRFTQKRNNKILTELHKVSKYIVDWLLENNIACLVIGKNDNWKQEVDIGKRNNQNFVYIPHAKLIDQLRYKCQRVGILLLTTEESYTSKCSFVDYEPLCSQKKVFPDNFGNQVEVLSYKGKRVKRGLFRTQDYLLVNSDINGAGNQIKKVAGDEVYTNSNSVVDVAVHPVRVCISV